MILFDVIYDSVFVAEFLSTECTVQSTIMYYLFGQLFVALVASFNDSFVTLQMFHKNIILVSCIVTLAAFEWFWSIFVVIFFMNFQKSFIIESSIADSALESSWIYMNTFDVTVKFRFSWIHFVTDVTSKPLVVDVFMLI
jgi:hypothetical protein